MTQIEGKYAHLRNENLDEYFRELGVPYVPRKMMCASHPSLEISKNNDEWSITSSTLFRTSVSKFKLGEPFEEQMPGGILKNISDMEGENKLVIKSDGPGEARTSRIYEFINDECTITYKNEISGLVAKRYFKRT